MSSFSLGERGLVVFERARFRPSGLRASAGTRAAADRAVRIVTGKPSIALKRPAKSARCIGSSFSSALRRSFSLFARIMRCMCGRRSSAKNMCSVRQRPMPSAPNWRASWRRAEYRRWRGLRACAADLTQLHELHADRDRRAAAGSVLSLPAMTRPVEPSSEIQSLA